MIQTRQRESEGDAVGNAETPPSQTRAVTSAPQPRGIERIKPHWPCPIIQNVVATVDLQCRLDLNIIAEHARNVEYNRKKFHAVIMRIRDPKTTTLIFASGKMVITGAKSAEHARLAARKHARAIQKVGFQTGFKDFKVQNFVGSCSVGFYIRLEGLKYQNPTFASYEPELFPGLVYRVAGASSRRLRGKSVPGQSSVLLIFANGKVVITGAKELNTLYETFALVYPLLLDNKVAE